MLEEFDVYLVGVGGQGIGLLSELLARAVDYSGQRVIGADTHGLAQRGGTVSSHVRIGEKANSVLVAPGTADMVISLERHEALRGMNDYLRDGGILVYYDTSWQPLDVRLRKAVETDNPTVSEEANRRNITLVRVYLDTLDDPRMQNMVVLSTIARLELVPNLKRDHYEAAIKDLLDGHSLDENLGLFNKLIEYTE